MNTFFSVLSCASFLQGFTIRALQWTFYYAALSCPRFPRSASLVPRLTSAFFSFILFTDSVIGYVFGFPKFVYHGLILIADRPLVYLPHTLFPTQHRWRTFTMSLAVPYMSPSLFSTSVFLVHVSCEATVLFEGDRR